MINEQIRDREIRLIGENGEQLGISCGVGANAYFSPPQQSCNKRANEILNISYISFICSADTLCICIKKAAVRRFKTGLNAWIALLPTFLFYKNFKATRNKSAFCK